MSDRDIVISEAINAARGSIDRFISADDTVFLLSLEIVRLRAWLRSLSGAEDALAGKPSPKGTSLAPV